jgi:ubiquinone/menaquinone biosynthesis C-methylase UbiE
VDPKAFEAPAAAPREFVKVAPLEGYRLWSRTWEADWNPLLALESRQVARLIGERPAGRFLDVACGTGRWLAAQGAGAVGVDFCAEMLACAAAKPGLRGRLALADARRLPLADGWASMVLLALALGYIAPLEDAVQELARVTAAGGVVIVSDLHPATAALGWKRTFRSGSRVYEIENHPYAVNRLIAAAQGAGLDLEELREPAFGEPERALFRRAGKERLFEEIRGVPALLIARWRRRP